MTQARLNTLSAVVGYLLGAMLSACAQSAEVVPVPPRPELADSVEVPAQEVTVPAQLGRVEIPEIKLLVPGYTIELPPRPEVFELPPAEWLGQGKNLRDYIVACAKGGKAAELPSATIYLQYADQFPRWSEEEPSWIPQGLTVQGAGSLHACGTHSGWQKRGSTLTTATVIVAPRTADPVFLVRGMRNKIRDLTIVGGSPSEPPGGVGIRVVEQTGWGANENLIQNVTLGNLLFPIVLGMDGRPNGSDTTLRDVGIDNCLTGPVVDGDQAVNTSWEGGGRAFFSRVDLWFWLRRGGLFHAPHTAGKGGKLFLRIDGGGTNTAPHFVGNIVCTDNNGPQMALVDATRARGPVQVHLEWFKGLSHMDAGGLTYLYPPRAKRYADASMITIGQFDRCTTAENSVLNVDEAGRALPTSAAPPEIGRWVKGDDDKPRWADLDELWKSVSSGELPEVVTAPSEREGD